MTLVVGAKLSKDSQPISAGKCKIESNGHLLRCAQVNTGSCRPPNDNSLISLNFTLQIRAGVVLFSEQNQPFAAPSHGTSVCLGVWLWLVAIGGMFVIGIVY